MTSAKSNIEQQQQKKADFRERRKHRMVGPQRHHVHRQLNGNLDYDQEQQHKKEDRQERETGHRRPTYQEDPAIGHGNRQDWVKVPEFRCYLII